ncbi:MAG TPA: hypothetical protein VJM79_00430 [Rhizorhapis sp.]|nr:hypothetical protein [Rhizorhapis sp.]
MDRVRSEKRKCELMVDSGAFSAWKRGVPVDLDEYIAYLKPYAHLFHSYVNLDVIPGAPDRNATPDEIEAAAIASHKNLRRMHKAGLDPMPVFHYGERFEHLHRLLDDGEPYIGLGGLANATMPQQIHWLDRIFTIITDRDGWPKVKTHGFGVASFDVLKRYPWTTCDATSWALTAAYGSIYVPVYRGGKPDYAQTPVKLTVSEVDRVAGKMPPDHYLRMGPMMRQRVEDFLTKEVGVNVKDAAQFYETRADAIAFFNLQFEKAIGPRPFRHHLRGLLADDRAHPQLFRRPAITDPLKIVFTCFANAAFLGMAVTKFGGRHQLLSYTDNRDKGLLDRFPDYVRDGYLKDFEVKNGKMAKARAAV